MRTVEFTFEIFIGSAVEVGKLKNSQKCGIIFLLIRAINLNLRGNLDGI